MSKLTKDGMWSLHVLSQETNYYLKQTAVVMTDVDNNVVKYSRTFKLVYLVDVLV